MSAYAAGVSLALVGTFCTAIGLNSQKLAHRKIAKIVEEGKPKPPYVKQPLWLVGLAGQVISAILSFFVMGFVGQSRSSSFAAFTVFLNSFLAAVLLKERFAAFDGIVSAFIITGSVVAVTFGSSGATAQPTKDITSIVAVLSRTICLVAGIIIAVVWVGVYVLVRRLAAKGKLRTHGEVNTEIMLRILLSVILSGLTGMLTASSVKAIRGAIETGDVATCAGAWQFWLMLLSLPVSLVGQLGFLNSALAQGDALMVVPPNQAGIIVVGLAWGMLFTGDASGASSESIGLFVLGCFISCCGVLLLAFKRGAVTRMDAYWFSIGWMWCLPKATAHTLAAADETNSAKLEVAGLTAAGSSSPMRQLSDRMLPISNVSGAEGGASAQSSDASGSSSTTATSAASAWGHVPYPYAPPQHPSRPASTAFGARDDGVGRARGFSTSTSSWAASGARMGGARPRLSSIEVISRFIFAAPPIEDDDTLDSSVYGPFRPSYYGGANNHNNAAAAQEFDQGEEGGEEEENASARSAAAIGVRPSISSDGGAIAGGAAAMPSGGVSNTSVAGGVVTSLNPIRAAMLANSAVASASSSSSSSSNASSPEASIGSGSSSGRGGNIGRSGSISIAGGVGSLSPGAGRARGSSVGFSGPSTNVRGALPAGSARRMTLSDYESLMENNGGASLAVDNSFGLVSALADVVSTVFASASNARSAVNSVATGDIDIEQGRVTTAWASGVPPPPPPGLQSGGPAPMRPPRPGSSSSGAPIVLSLVSEDNGSSSGSNASSTPLSGVAAAASVSGGASAGATPTGTAVTTATARSELTGLGTIIEAPNDDDDFHDALSPGQPPHTTSATGSHHSSSASSSSSASQQW